MALPLHGRWARSGRWAVEVENGVHPAVGGGEPRPRAADALGRGQGRDEYCAGDERRTTDSAEAEGMGGGRFARRDVSAASAWGPARN